MDSKGNKWRYFFQFAPKLPSSKTVNVKLHHLPLGPTEGIPPVTSSKPTHFTVLPYGQFVNQMENGN